MLQGRGVTELPDSFCISSRFGSHDYMVKFLFLRPTAGFSDIFGSWCLPGTGWGKNAVPIFDEHAFASIV